MENPKDDIEALRTVINTVKEFQPDEQQRIFRWAAEKLNLPRPFAAPTIASPTIPQPATGAALSPGTAQLAQPTTSNVDIKSFVAQKRPRSDVQFAATVAYYYRFASPQSTRKEAIDKDTLQDASRRAGRNRFSDPRSTLNNAHRQGLLDRGAERGTFTINTVGENLVAMTLPDGAEPAEARKKHPVKKPKGAKPPRKPRKA